MTQTEARPGDRLFENYHRCLAWRLDLWFGPEARVERHGSTLTVRYGQRIAQLEFHPQACRWSMTCGAVAAEGSFDRVSKRLRQVFSGLA